MAPVLKIMEYEKELKQSGKSQGIEHSENNIIMQSGLFENEIRPGVLWSSVQQTRALQDFQRLKVFATNYVLILSFL